MNKIKQDGVSFDLDAVGRMSLEDFMQAHGHLWPKLKPYQRDAVLRSVHDKAKPLGRGPIGLIQDSKPADHDNSSINAPQIPGDGRNTGNERLNRDDNALHVGRATGAVETGQGKGREQS